MCAPKSEMVEVSVRGITLGEYRAALAAVDWEGGAPDFDALPLYKVREFLDEVLPSRFELVSEEWYRRAGKLAWNALIDWYEICDSEAERSTDLLALPALLPGETLEELELTEAMQRTYGVHIIDTMKGYAEKQTN